MAARAFASAASRFVARPVRPVRQEVRILICPRTHWPAAPQVPHPQQDLGTTSVLVSPCSAATSTSLLRSSMTSRQDSRSSLLSPDLKSAARKPTRRTPPSRWRPHREDLRREVDRKGCLRPQWLPLSRSRSRSCRSSARSGTFVLRDAHHGIRKFRRR